MSREEHAGRSIARALAGASIESLGAGNLALAHAQLAECLGVIQTSATYREGAEAFRAAAELAAAIGANDFAVEFYGACDRAVRKARGASDHDAEIRAEALARLKREMGDERFASAWMASRTTPVPLEFYISKSMTWLQDIETHVRHDAGRRGLAATPGNGADAGVTAKLIRRARDGHPSALSRLAARYLEPLRRFAHGRLPAKARGTLDTDDLVQVSMVRGLAKVDALEDVKEGQFFAYLRMILINQIRDQIRRFARRPQSEALSDTIASKQPDPLAGLLQREALAGFQRALGKLPKKSRDAVMLRIGDGRSYQEVAEAVGCPSANAARMLVNRALAQVAAHMERESNRG